MPDPTEDLLAMTLGELVDLVAERRRSSSTEYWIDPKSEGCPVPYRQVLAAGQRGELKLFKVGRKYPVRWSELDAWIKRPEHRVDRAPPTADSGGSADLVLQRNGWRRGRDRDT